MGFEGLRYTAPEKVESGRKEWWVDGATANIKGR